MKFLSFVLLISLAVASKAQNLVPNGSFEDIMKCGDIGQPCNPAGWLYIKRGSMSGYTHAHTVDGIPAFNGDGKLCITVGNRMDKRRTYWETTLLNELEKGKRYKLAMHIRGWGDPPNLNDLGVWLVDSLFFFDQDTLLQPKEYIDILQARAKPEKNGWFLVEREIIPDRNVRCLVLGNFSPKDYQQVAQGRYSNSFYICDFVDDIRIEPVIKEPCVECPHIRDSVYLASQLEFLKQRMPRKKDTIVKAVTKVIDTLELPNILFAFNSSKLLDSNYLMQYKSIFLDSTIRKIVVAGYTDTVGIKVYNVALAERRAQEVAKQIEDRFMINPATIVAVGRGVSDKYVEMDKNRRVEIYVFRN